MTSHNDVHRRVLSLVSSRFTEEPVILLEGPRTVGKSTLLRACAQVHGADVIDLDDLTTREAIAEDPKYFLKAPGPVFIDEYQKVPAVLDAIKAELNRDTRPGRFVLAGSTRHDSLPVAAQALTGRLHKISIYPFTQTEIEGSDSQFILQWLNDPPQRLDMTSSLTPRDEYIDRVLRGGFPLAVTRTAPARDRWFDDYIALTVERDAREISDIRHAAGLHRLLIRLAGQTGQVLNLGAAGNAVDLASKTTDTYAKLLEALFLVYRLPAWGVTVGSRSAARPKVHVTDSGVGGWLLGLTTERLGRRDPSAYTEFGHILESFVVGEILRQASWLENVRRIGHWRTYDGTEVDLVVERTDGRVVAFEIKGSTRATSSQFASLRKLRDHLGDAFLAGIVFHVGEYSHTVEDRLHAMSVDRLWVNKAVSA